MSRRLSLVAFVAVAFSSLAPIAGCAAPTEAETASTEDAVSAADRAQIMDALRAKIRPELKNQDVVFDVSAGHFAAKEGFAFLTGQIRLKHTGGPVDYRGTEYQQYIDEGIFDDHIDALLKKENGNWIVKARAIGSTDVAWWGWWDEYRAPRSLFPGQHEEDPAQADRRAVMESLRTKLKPELKNQDIVFNVRDGGTYAAEGGFVFLRGQIQLSDGRPIDYRGTEYQQYIDEGMFDDGFAALLKKDNGAFVVKAYAIGSTDVPWVTWAEDHGAPASIFR